IRRGVKFLLTSTLCKLLARIKGYSSLHLHNLPFSIIDQFDATIRKSMLDEKPFPNYPTLFDVLRERQITYAYVDSSVLKRRVLGAVDKVSPNTEFAMVYLHYVDEASHWFGLDSQRFKRTIRSIDSIVNYIVKKLSRPGETPLILIFSDHGMIKEKERLDLSFLGKVDGFGTRFIFVSDATMVRVWYLDPNSREHVRNVIERSD